MEYLCKAGNYNGSSTVWVYNICQTDWINIITSLFSINVALLLIGYLRWVEGNRVPINTGARLRSHNFRSGLSLILYLIHFAEIADAFLSKGSYRIYILPATSLILLVVVLILQNQIERTKSTVLMLASGSLWLSNGIARAVRLVALRHIGIEWDRIRPVTAAISSLVYLLISASGMFIDGKEQTRKPGTRFQVQSYRHDEAHFFSKATFYWMNSLLKTGYNSPIELDDLGELPYGHSAKQLHRKLEMIAEKYESKKSLWKVFMVFMKPDFCIAGVFKLLGDLIGIIGPLGISVLVNFVVDQKISKHAIHEQYPSICELWRNGWTMAFIVFFASIAQSTFSQASTHTVNVRAIQLKVALQSLIYKKSLRLRKCQSSTDKKIHEENMDFGILTNLMSNDVTNIMSFFWVGHYIWAIPVKMSVIMFFLYMKLGVSAIAGAAGTILIIMPLQLSIGKKMSRNAAAMSELSDERLLHVGTLIEKFKLFKLLGWERYYCNRILKVRQKELQYLDKDSAYWAVLTFFTHASSVLVSVIIFGLHFLFNDSQLTSDSVFTTLALINQLMVPLFIFPVIIPTIAEAMVSCVRIDEFLNHPEIRVKREIIKKDIIGVKAFATHSGMTMISDTNETRLSHISNNFTILKNNASELSFEEHEVEKSDLDDVNEYPQNEFSENCILKMNGARFSWHPESPQQNLTVDNLNIAQGEIVLIIGKVGSGKSSLLSAILGEMTLLRGKFILKSDTTVAYCPQSPWLLNATIRDNIIFGLPFRPLKYNQVLDACCLNVDLDILPKKDFTEIGEGGINLSGGQRQRIAIARALYSKANLIIMDDPFSSLDLTTAAAIFEGGIKKLITRRNRTVVLTTHNLQFLSDCHLVVIIEDGEVKAQGKPNDIRLSDFEYLKNCKESSFAVYNSNQESRAKERWHLIKAVAKMRRTMRVKGMGCCSSFFPEEVLTVLSTSKGRFDKCSGWNYITHDLPLPTDEFQNRFIDCSPTWRRNSMRKGIGRARSLQDRHSRAYTVARQYSSPLTSDTSKQYRKEFINHCVNAHLKVKGQFESSVDIRASTKAGMTDLCSNEGTEVEEDAVYIKKPLEEREYGKMKKNVYMSYATACGIKLIIGYLLVTLTWQIVRVNTDFWLSVWTETLNTNQLLKCMSIYICLSTSCVILSLISHGLGQYAGSKARKKLHDNLLINIVRSPNKFFESTPAGRIINIFASDMEVLDKKLATTIQRLLQFLLFCCSSIVLNAIITPWFIVITAPTVLLYYIIQMFYRCSSRELQRIDSITRSSILSDFAQTLAGLTSIRAFGYEERFISDFSTKLNQNTNAFLILNSTNRWLGIVLDYLGGVIVLLAMMTALTAAHIYSDSITPSLIGLAMNYTLLVPIYLNWVVKFFVDFEVYLGAVERIRHYTKIPAENYNPVTGASVISSKSIKEGDIRFENVVVGYGSSVDPALIGINLHIPPGQKIGICGRSGSGKSTLALSLFNMLEIQEGKIKIDEIDISKIPLTLLRGSGSIIPQDTLFFNGTVRENLDASGISTDEQMWSAIEQAHLKEIIKDQYRGSLDSEMNAGQHLSGGQKQLFSLARAILQNSSFLIMDEATSNLDKESEQILMTTAQNVFKGKTLIIIAHRLSTVLDCDRILVLDRGRIAEDGTPRSLLNKNGGLFSAMVKSSEEGFLVP